jgi:hypothetical protein
MCPAKNRAVGPPADLATAFGGGTSKFSTLREVSREEPGSGRGYIKIRQNMYITGLTT